MYIRRTGEDRDNYYNIIERDILQVIIERVSRYEGGVYECVDNITGLYHSKTIIVLCK